MLTLNDKMKSVEKGAINTVSDLTKNTFKRGESIMAPAIVSKICPTCKSGLSTKDFYNNRSKPDGLSTMCKSCTNTSNEPAVAKYKRELRQRGGCSAVNRRYAFKSKYGISVAEYDALVDFQDGKCAICDIKPGRTLNVDHCHETGRVRGLLCAKCNQSLGVFGDNVEGLQKAMDYLLRTGTNALDG